MYDMCMSTRVCWVQASAQGTCGSQKTASGAASPLPLLPGLQGSDSGQQAYVARALLPSHLSAPCTEIT